MNMTCIEKLYHHVKLLQNSLLLVVQISFDFVRLPFIGSHYVQNKDHVEILDDRKNEKKNMEIYLLLKERGSAGIQ